MNAPLGMAGAIGLSRFVLPEKKQLIVDSGIPLFELRKLGLNYQGTKDFAYWDVRVREEINNFTQAFYYVKSWYQGPTAYIDYTPNKKGICFAFCPDDPEWHNRIMLSANLRSGLFIIERYHTREGTLAGAVAAKEIEIIRDALHDWKVEAGKKVLLRTKNRKEAEAFILEYNENKDHNPKASIVWSKIQRIEEIISVRRGNWFKSQEFIEEFRKPLEDKITNYHAAQSPDPNAIGSALISQLERMNEEQRKRVADLLGVARQEQYQSNEGGKIEVDNLKIDQLRRIAAQRNIDVKGMIKQQIIEAIKEDMKSAAAQAPEGASNDRDRYEGVEEPEAAVSEMEIT